jgi:hypothetical protein
MEYVDDNNVGLLPSARCVSGFGFYCICVLNEYLERDKSLLIRLCFFSLLSLPSLVAAAVNLETARERLACGCAEKFAGLLWERW